MLVEIIKALLMGIVEGVTEWLPISSTGHMILVEQLIQFEASDAFLSMFRVVIQLGAIMAVVVLFWGKLWPFGCGTAGLSPRPRSGACGSRWWWPPCRCWSSARWTSGWRPNSTITSPWAAMLILYGILFIVVENRGTSARVTRLDQISYREALIIGLWQTLAIIPRHLPQRRHHRGRPAAGAVPRGGGRVHLLPGHPGHGGGRPCSRWSSSCWTARP